MRATTTPIIVPRWFEEPEEEGIMVFGAMDGVVEFTGGGGV